MSTPILMPALSPTMEEGTLAKWHIKVGDKVKSGDVIAEIETDKATMEVEAVDEGVVAELLIAEGTEGVKVNAVIAQLSEEGEKYTPAAKASAAAPAPKPAALKAEAKPGAAAQAPAPVAAASSVAPATVAAPREPAPAGQRVFASPLARRIASQGNVQLTLIQGSGPHGRIVKSDVDAALKGGVAKAPAATPAQRPAAAPATAPAAPSSMPDARLFYPKDSYDEVPHDSMRKTIAKRLTTSKRDIPHYYLKIDCTIDTLLDVRKQMNDKAPTEGAGIYNL